MLISGKDFDFFWDLTDKEWDEADIISFIKGVKEAVITFRDLVKSNKVKNNLFLAEVSLITAINQV